ncbi:hypothetical protein EMF73_32040 [Klebsiella pneumoniae]|nr:hypothetical protein EMF73_32040 [Klebsiella pneumoniae]
MNRIVDLAYKMLDKHPRDVRKATVIAFVVKGDTIISYGFNRRRFANMKGLWTYHAEEQALKKAGPRSEGSILYVIRIKKNMDLGLAKPCDYCTKLIIDRGISKVIYS